MQVRFARSSSSILALAALSCAAPPMPEPAPTPIVDEQLITLRAPRELRGLWVATVANLDWPSKPGLAVDRQRAELRDIVDNAGALGFNALVFQVRPEGDAFYQSELEPWSRFLTGKQGHTPGFDPLAELIELSHARGIAVHAWFNPYRAASSRKAARHEAHVSNWGAKHARPWGGLLWLDPGAPQMRDHTLAVIADVVARYEIDGVHLDDYFYPYPEGRQDFPDATTYGDYQRQGGALERSAWRRSNVDALVGGIAGLVHRLRPSAQFGISPFGIYRPGIPEGIRGLDQVATLNADPIKWYEEGWVDYLAPQLYWPTTREAQRYDKLLNWWNAQATDGRPMIVGLDATKVGRDPAWPVDELRKQIALARAADRTHGQIWFRAAPVLANQGGLADLATELYASPALPPAPPRQQDVPVAPPVLTATASGLSINHEDRRTLGAFVLYEQVNGDWRAVRVLNAQAIDVATHGGYWAVAAVGRHGVESEARWLQLDGPPAPAPLDVEPSAPAVADAADQSGAPQQ